MPGQSGLPAHRRGVGRILGAGLAGALLCGAVSAAEPADVTPVLDIVRNAGMLEIIAGAEADRPIRITALLVVERTGPAGSVTTRQSTEMDAAPGRPARFAVSSLSFSPGDTASITLVLSSDGRQIAARSRDVTADETARLPASEVP
jgi:hypothetical protein